MPISKKIGASFFHNCKNISYRYIAAVAFVLFFFFTFVSFLASTGALMLQINQIRFGSFSSIKINHLATNRLRICAAFFLGCCQSMTHTRDTFEISFFTLTAYTVCSNFVFWQKVIQRSCDFQMNHGTSVWFFPRTKTDGLWVIYLLELAFCTEMISIAFRVKT